MSAVNPNLVLKGTEITSYAQRYPNQKKGSDDIVNQMSVDTRDNATIIISIMQSDEAAFVDPTLKFVQTLQTKKENNTAAAMARQWREENARVGALPKELRRRLRPLGLS